MSVEVGASEGGECGGAGGEVSREAGEDHGHWGRGGAGIGDLNMGS